MKISGKVIVVTGAASGMGKLASQRYAQAGNKVVGLDMNEVGLKETRESNENISTKLMDITDYSAVEKVIKEIESEVGPIDRLVNCAGIMPLGTLNSQNVNLIHKIMEVNYSGTVNINKAVLPFMLSRGKGEIVNFASIAGHGPSISFGAYNAAKAAVVIWSEVLHHENKHTGIDVVCVCPPPVNTPLLNNAINVPKVLKSSPVVEPEFILDAMEKSLEKRQLFCFPGVTTKIAYVARRWMPNVIWSAIHRVEGKDFSRLETQPQAPGAKAEKKDVA